MPGLDPWAEGGIQLPVAVEPDVEGEIPESPAGRFDLKSTMIFRGAGIGSFMLLHKRVEETATSGG
jgi:hypothetical protein